MVKRLTFSGGRIDADTTRYTYFLVVDGWFGPDWYSEAKKEAFTSLPITAQHSNLAGQLTDIHTDPFDRILIAQTQIEALTLMTDDKAIEKYKSIQLF